MNRFSVMRGKPARKIVVLDSGILQINKFAMMRSGGIKTCDRNFMSVVAVGVEMAMSKQHYTVVRTGTT